MPTLQKLFNRIISSKSLPDEWQAGEARKPKQFSKLKIQMTETLFRISVILNEVKNLMISIG
jgi:hypothetical protein